MEELRIELKNCYGIRKMDLTVDYSNNNVAIIYAPNGTMKSSLANVFKNVRDGIDVEERIFGRKSVYSIKDENGDGLFPKNIMVINPFDENAFDGQGLLMANESLRKQYLLIHKSIDDKKNMLFCKLKNALGYTKRNSFDTESVMLNDWNCNANQEYECLSNIISQIGNPFMECAINVDQLKYEELFNEKAIQMIKTDDIAILLEEYEKQYNEIINKSPYMQRGVIDYNNYGTIGSTLRTNGFFKAKNKITLNAKDGTAAIEINSKEELDSIIKIEKEKVLNTESIKQLFERINKALYKNKDTQAFASFLQDNPDLVAEYKDVELFKRKVWIKIIAVYRTEVEELLAEVKEAQKELCKLTEIAQKETTDWKRALIVFKQRFYVPFDIETTNQEDVILKAVMPAFRYVFTDEDTSIEVSKENLLDVLSTGEKRAYYILNMIFQVLVSEKQDQEHILILDDISESFDYKNKYAIIEYIKDIADISTSDGSKAFKILILTHNFDFYRTIASRITHRGNSYIAYSDGEKICFEKGQYVKNVFGYYKERLITGVDDSIIVASIPFVRNLIEYTEGINNADYLLLTSVLHNKNDTWNITLKDIQDIFNKYWCKNPNATFASGRENERIIDIIIKEANKVADEEKLAIENKLILAIALRQKAELYMKDKIASEVPNGKDIISEISKQNDQSGKLTKAYKQYIKDENMDLMETVAMITPENIHLNSFMFEPIMDMSLRHLYGAYHRMLSIE